MTVQRALLTAQKRRRIQTHILYEFNIRLIQLIWQLQACKGIAQPHGGMLHLYLSRIRLAEASGSSAAGSSLLSVVSALPLLLTKRYIAPPTATTVNRVDIT